MRLKELRKKKGVTQQVIADSLNIERALYGRYEDGSRKPPLPNLIKLADYFHVSTDYLLGLTEDSWQPAEITLDEVDAIEIEYLQFAREARKLGQAEQDIVKRIIKTAIEAGLKAQEDEDNKR